MRDEPLKTKELASLFEVQLPRGLARRVQHLPAHSSSAIYPAEYAER